MESATHHNDQDENCTTSLEARLRIVAEAQDKNSAMHMCDDLIELLSQCTDTSQRIVAILDENSVEKRSPNQSISQRMSAIVDAITTKDARINPTALLSPLPCVECGQHAVMRDMFTGAVSRNTTVQNLRRSVICRKCASQKISGSDPDRSGLFFKLFGTMRDRVNRISLTNFVG